MCLIIDKDTECMTAKKDIVVYKHLIKRDDGTYATSYQRFPIEIGETYKSDLIRENNTIYIGLHSYINKEDAEKEAKFYKEVLVKCIIPKKSEYYEGDSLAPSLSSPPSSSRSCFQYIKIC